MPDPHDLAKTYYNAARAEVLQRISLREQVLLAGVTAFGVIAGLAVSGKSPALLNIGPVVSLAFTVLFFRHHILMHDLGRYIKEHLSQSLAVSATPADGEAPMPLHWDAWLATPGRGRRASRTAKLRVILLFELFGAWLLLWAPGLGALLALILSRHINTELIWFDGACLLLSILPYLSEATGLLSRWS